jgi:hypothetical protein
VNGNDVVVTDPGGTVDPSGPSVLDDVSPVPFVVDVELEVDAMIVDGEISMLVVVVCGANSNVVVLVAVVELVPVLELVDVSVGGVEVLVLDDVELDVELELDDELVPSSVVDVLDDDVEDDVLLDDELEEEEELLDDGPVVDVVVEPNVSHAQSCFDVICTGAFPRGDDMNCANCGPAHFTPCSVTKISWPGASAYVVWTGLPASPLTMNGIAGAPSLLPCVIQNVIVVGPSCGSNGSEWFVQLMTSKFGFVAFGGHSLMR